MMNINFYYKNAAPALGIIKILLLSFLLWQLPAFPHLNASDTEEKAFKRKVMVYYNSKTQVSKTSNNVSELFGLYFNYYGMDVKYQDIDSSIDDDSMMKWADIFIIHSEEVSKNYPRLCEKLLSYAGEKRIVFLDIPDKNTAEIKLLKRIGFLISQQNIGAGDVKSVFIDSRLKLSDKKYELDRSQDFLKLIKNPDRDNVTGYFTVTTATNEIAVVAGSENGAVALIDKIVRMNDDGDIRYWLIDPAFLTKMILGINEFPVPDPCVKSGTRAAFIHVDGDGYSYKPLYSDKRYSGEIVFDEIINRYKLPVTVSFIVSEIHPDEDGNYEIGINLKNRTAHGYIEIGSHSWYHPFNWEIFENNIQAKPESEILETDQIIGSMKFYKALDAGKTSLYHEIIDSSGYISKITGKKCQFIFWSGKCNPGVKALELCDKYGLGNINGGDTRFDPQVNTFRGFEPHFVYINNLIRFNARYVNEFILTNRWSGPFDGYGQAITGFEKTMSPRLITPIDIYYHFYIATRLDSLNSLMKVYDYVISQYPFFMTVSEWTERLRLSLGVKIYALKNNKDRVLENFSGCDCYYSADKPIMFIKKFRIENARNFDNFRWDYEGWPFIKNASYVIGFNVINTAKYIISGGSECGDMEIIDRPPDYIYLKSVNARIKSVEKNIKDKNSIKIKGDCNAPLLFKFGGAVPGKYSAGFIIKNNGGNAIEEKKLNLSCDTGELEIKLPYCSGSFEISVSPLTAKVFGEKDNKNFYYLIDEIQKALSNLNFKIDYKIIIVLILYLYFIFKRKKK